jgi:hypothetical protein
LPLHRQHSDRVGRMDKIDDTLARAIVVKNIEKL